MGNKDSQIYTPPPPPPPPPSAPMYNMYSSGITTYKIPSNSGSIDIDVNNLQRCINQGGGSICITNYVQGYDTQTNTFVPSQVAQGFELLENFDNLNNSQMTLIIFIIITVLIVLLK
jgi:hypothetical protein